MVCFLLTLTGRHFFSPETGAGTKVFKKFYLWFSMNFGWLSFTENGKFNWIKLIFIRYVNFSLYKKEDYISLRLVDQRLTHSEKVWLWLD